MSIFHLAQMEQHTRLRCCLHLLCRKCALLGATWVCPSLTSMLAMTLVQIKLNSYQKKASEYQMGSSRPGHAGQQAQNMQGLVQQLPSDCQDGSLQKAGCTCCFLWQYL